MQTTGELLINVDAIANNWQQLNKRVGAAECGAVVKADAYGLGVLPIAKSLHAVGCRTFFVATINEAVQLRDVLGSTVEIVVLGGQAAKYYQECLQYKLTPVLISEEQIYSWLSSSKELFLPSIVKFDSGMHRFGVSPEIFETLLAKDVFRLLQPACFMSHLACADTPDHPQNVEQLKHFSRACQQLKKQLPECRASLANSSGCFLDEAYFFDLCRPGIALYGGNPTPDSDNPMQSVVALHLPIMQIKHLKEGDAVGYGAQYRVAHSTQIALVFGGYADGLFRCLYGQGHGFIGDYLVPMVGRVSMDAIAFDISSVPGDVLKNYSSIEILGEHQSIDALAAQAGTISYEILTSLGSRYRRRYLTSNQAS